MDIVEALEEEQVKLQHQWAASGARRLHRLVTRAVQTGAAVRELYPRRAERILFGRRRRGGRGSG
jgi:hypothetical protein